MKTVRTIMIIVVAMAAMMVGIPDSTASEPCTYTITMANNHDLNMDGLLDPGTETQCVTYEVFQLVHDLRADQQQSLLIISAQQDTIARQAATIVRLRARIARLRARLAAQ